jgi:Carboxypeptidase regulatory-like domain
MGKHIFTTNARLGAVATAVLAVVMGTAGVLPPHHHGEAAAMVPTGVDLLHGIGTGEPLPGVAPADLYTPDAPRQVAGPDPLPDPVTPVATPGNPTPSTTAPAPYVVSVGASRSIPPQVLAAYQAAARTLATEQRSCHLPWALLAGIGRIESDHADNGSLDATGKAVPPIIGPKLDGTGNFARITDTDSGLWDGDRKYDRAIGPMQFLPDTWRGVGRDGNGDGIPDPENINDAALGSATFLCAGGGDLATRNGLLAAVYRYNRSWEYVSMVLTWAGIYAGALPTVAPAATPTPSTAPTTRPSPHPTTPSTPHPTPSQPAAPSAPPVSQPDPTPTPPGPTPPAVTTGALTGQVLDQLGKPVPNVTVALHGPTEISVRTDDTGTWLAADLVPGAYAVGVPETDGYLVPTNTVPVTALLGQTLLLTPFALTALPPADAQAPPADGTSVVTSP